MMNSNVLTKARFEFDVLQDVNFHYLREVLGGVAPLYPNFDIWLNFTFRRNVASGQRKVAVAHNGSQIQGVALLKKDVEESKICTFYVLPECRGLGVGGELLDLAVAELGSQEKVITVSDERMNELTPLLSSRGFEVISSCNGLYREGSTEHFFIANQ